MNATTKENCQKIVSALNGDFKFGNREKAFAALCDIIAQILKELPNE